MMMTIPHSLPGCRWGESVTILTSGCSWSGTNSFSVSVTTGPHGSGNCCCSLLVDQWNRLLRTRFISENSNSIAVAVYSEDLARTILSFNDLRMYVVSDKVHENHALPSSSIFSTWTNTFGSACNCFLSFKSCAKYSEFFRSTKLLFGFSATAISVYFRRTPRLQLSTTPLQSKLFPYLREKFIAHAQTRPFSE